jgi:hypothetical protein
MISAQNSSKASFLEGGIFATPRAILRVVGSRVLSRQSVLCGGVMARGAGGLVAVVAVMLLLASPAGAATPPRFEKRTTSVRVYSTRVHVFIEVEEFKLETQMTAEYAPAEKNGEAPPEGSPAWTVVNKETQPGHILNPINLGVEDPGLGNANAYLRHLSPNTAYYARFIVENEEGRAVETVPFKTLELAEPELTPLFFNSENPVNGFYSRLFTSEQGSATSESFHVMVESNGSETAYRVEYSLPENGHAPAVGSPSWKLFTSNATGTITPAAEYAQFKAQVTGLAPETSYYVRVRASNAQGELIQTKYWGGSGGSEEFSTFTTATARPKAEEPEVRNVTAASAYVAAEVSPDGSKTVWRLESAASPSGPWAVIPGGAGTVSQALAEATPYGDAALIGARLGGLDASTPYYVRLVAENQCAEGCGTATSTVASFETSGAPSATTFMVHTLDGEALRLIGVVNPNSQATTAEQVIALGGPSGGTFTLTFKGHTTAPIAYDASLGAVESALHGLEGNPQVHVEGLPGGPYTVSFNGGDVQGAQPPIEADGLGLVPPSTVTVTVTQQGGEAYDTHYRFRYVSEKSFEAHGWAEAQETAELDAGSGTSPQIVGGDLPSLTPGETYRYRVVASNTAPGTGAVEGAEQSLTVPIPASVGETGCPNEVFRTGLSARLPDCRAYEMVTPVDKEGAQEPFNYQGGIADAVLAGADGEHVALEATGVHWGKGAGSGLSPYFFSRTEGVGWSMVAGSPQPETGVYLNAPEVYSADLESFAFQAAYQTSPGEESPVVEYKVGPAGGPYTTVASIPRTDATIGWVAADSDLSKLVLATTDRTLAGEESTGTKSGSDLYEYTAGGGLRQLNVAGEAGVTIGRCGASMAEGQERLESRNEESSPHSVSLGGSHVFFEAVPGSNCSEPSHLYMRVNGSETVDIGAYQFERVDAQGTTLLLRDSAGNLVGYDTETREVQPEPPGELTSAAELAQLGVPYPFQPQQGDAFHHRRYIYNDFCAPGQTGVSSCPVLRYDTVEHLLVCMSCASSFNPGTGVLAYMNGGDGIPHLHGGALEYTAGSADGRFAFFTTPSALLAQDIDGETPIEDLLTHQKGEGTGEYIDNGHSTSPSSDVYEWRADGVDGCVQLRGCLALITDGRGGYLNLLLGTADEGRDVFIYTRSRLLPQDTDTSGDIYDVRVDGGFAPAPPPAVECEGDACSVPPSQPNDATPSSLTFSGAGNLIPVPSSKAGVKSKKPKHKHTAKTHKKRKQTKKTKKAKKARSGEVSASRGRPGKSIGVSK